VPEGGAGAGSGAGGAGAASGAGGAGAGGAESGTAGAGTVLTADPWFCASVVTTLGDTDTSDSGWFKPLTAASPGEAGADGVGVVPIGEAAF